MREETRKQKKLESAFLMCLQDLNIDPKLEWEEAREKILEESAFKAITLESERIRLFKVSELSIFLDMNPMLLNKFKSILASANLN